MKRSLLILMALAIFAPAAWAMEATTQALSLITHPVWYTAIGIFCVAYHRSYVVELQSFLTAVTRISPI